MPVTLGPNVQNTFSFGSAVDERKATLKAGTTEQRNDGMGESRNGGKYPQILQDGITENHPKS